MNIPKIVKDEAEKYGFEPKAAFLGNVNGLDIYSLGVESKECWFPCPPEAPVIVAVKAGKRTEIEDGEAFDSALSLQKP